MTSIGFRVKESGKVTMHNSVPPVDFQHVLCEGATGSGKTASLILPTLVDRMKSGHTIIFFDHKGHEHKKLKALAEQVGRLDDVVEIGKPHASYVNLLAELDTIRLKETIREVSGSKDPYWANSAANLLEDIIVPLRKLHELISVLKPYTQFDIISTEIAAKMKKIDVDIFAAPSFQTLSSILSSPKQVKAYKEVLEGIPHDLEHTLKENYELGDKRINNRRDILAKTLIFKKSTLSLARFDLEEEGATASGNNGVFQVLSNTIASYAKKDYINREEYSIAALMDSNAIVVIDTQSFGEDILKLLLESILKKSVMQLRTGSEKPMSVFIDEANRVLFPSIDLHSDVLREAKVELIIAIQNQEQMINKFGQSVWDAVRINIKHQYFINITHGMYYNDNNCIHVEPLLMQEEALRDSEYLFYGMAKNQHNIEKHFLGEVDTLPEKFMVHYDLDRFEHESAIVIEDPEGKAYVMCYYGEEIVNRVNSTYPVTGTPRITSDHNITLSLDHIISAQEQEKHEYGIGKTEPIGGLFEETIEYIDPYDIVLEE